MKLHDWLNLVAAVSVLVGIGLVAVELRQTNELARAETVRSLWYADSDIDMFAIENGLQPLIRKSVNNPLDLTNEEIDKLDEYLTIQMQHQITVSLMRDQYDLAIGTTEAQAADIADDVLVGRFARGWFQANEYWLSEWHPELVAAIQHEFSTTPVAHEYELPSRIRESVRQVVEDK